MPIITGLSDEFCRVITNQFKSLGVCTVIILQSAAAVLSHFAQHDLVSQSGSCSLLLLSEIPSTLDQHKNAVFGTSRFEFVAVYNDVYSEESICEIQRLTD